MIDLIPSSLPCPAPPGSSVVDSAHRCRTQAFESMTMTYISLKITVVLPAGQRRDAVVVLVESRNTAGKGWPSPPLSCVPRVSGQKEVPRAGREEKLKVVGYVLCRSYKHLVLSIVILLHRRKRYGFGAMRSKSGNLLS